jgi:hypothetical protein
MSNQHILTCHKQIWPADKNISELLAIPLGQKRFNDERSHPYTRSMILQSQNQAYSIIVHRQS